MSDEELFQFSLTAKKLRERTYPRIANAWPDSVKADFVSFVDAGADQKKLITFLGISEVTMKNWFYQVRKKRQLKESKNTFKEVALVADNELQASTSNKFTIKFPSGSFLENISIEDLARLKNHGIL